MSRLFTSLALRGVTLKNRIVMSPMCQYSCVDGLADDWHFVHLGSRAIGGAALVLTEATAVSPEGRITPNDAGLWNDRQTEAFKRITDFISSAHAIPGIQLAHAGRKASTYAPGKGEGEVKPEHGGWQTWAPSAARYSPSYPLPSEMTNDDIQIVTEQFRAAAERSIRAGFKLIEIHAAHGYLLHEFLSPLSNQRTDEYGGSLDHRIRFLLEVTAAIRRVVPDAVPVIVRISSTDWTDGGWDIDQSVYLAWKLKDAGVDLIDASSGGNISHAAVPAGPGYQVPFAERIRRESGIMTGAVGFITSPEQAEQIIVTGQADVVILARALLRNPYWPLEAARQLKAEIEWPNQYLRAKI
ncbi:MAG: NADH:flavin oxidoreductase/NADH oxidase [Ignavibacteriae bacterium]|nr:MAG: NADH:flavin oxidoreductase/NADH oxidase [Ignavibacteriota bacterium]